MAQIPATLQGYSCFVFEQGYAGRIVRGTPPKLVKKMLQHGSGMHSPVGVFGGFEEFTCEFVLREFNADIARHMRRTDMSGSQTLDVRMVGAQSAGTERSLQDRRLMVEAVEWEVSGQATEMDFGQIDAADPESELRVMMACGRVKLTIADSVIWDIDVPKSTAIIDDVDVWQQLLTDLDPPEVPSERGESRSPFGL